MTLLQYGYDNLFYSVQEVQSFLRIVGTMKQIVKTSSNFTFSLTAEGVERTLKTVFDFVFSKMT